LGEGRRGGSGHLVVLIDEPPATPTAPAIWSPTKSGLPPAKATKGRLWLVSSPARGCPGAVMAARSPVSICIEQAVYALEIEISMLASKAPVWRAKATSSRPSSTTATLDGTPISSAFLSAA
jgi:hypothetical protein